MLRALSQGRRSWNTRRWPAGCAQPHWHWTNRALPSRGFRIMLVRRADQWRVVKGGEGLEQLFTPIFPWPSETYTVKVKGEGFLEIFFGVHRLLKKKQCKITKFPPHIQTFPRIFSFKSRDKQVNSLLIVSYLDWNAFVYSANLTS